LQHKLEELQVRRDRLNQLAETFGTEGWGHFTEDLTTFIRVLKDTAVENCDSGDKWLARRAVILELEAIANYQAASEAELEAIEQLLQNPEADDDDGRNPLEE